MTDIAFKHSVNNAHRGEFQTAEKRKSAVLEFRRTHFTMGNHPTTHYSQAKYEQRHWKGSVGAK